jgi:hypothetical protein
MVFGGVWTTTTRTSGMAYCTPKCEHSTRVRSASVSILRRGLPQQRHIEISDSPFGFVRRTAETDHIEGRAFLPSPKGQGFTRPFR